MGTLDAAASDRLDGMVWGAFIADALAMPGHWYYDRGALAADYGPLDHYQAPKEPHPDSILWRSKYEAPGPGADILGWRAQWWGQRGVHYHRELAAGENTLNLALARRLGAWLRERGGYDLGSWLGVYAQWMLEPTSHRDTYIEEYHREFFTAKARGRKPEDFRGADPHIGGLAAVPVFCHELPRSQALEAVRLHVGFSHSGEVAAAGQALAEMLFDVAGGRGLRETVEVHGKRWLSRRQLEDWSRRDDLEVVGKILSPACYIGGAFPAALFFAWKYAGRFREGIVANAMAGGDNCHRGVVAGALLGAETGLAGLPGDWKDGLRHPPLPATTSPAAAPTLSQIR